jgi:hypothetical protein
MRVCVGYVVRVLFIRFFLSFMFFTPCEGGVFGLFRGTHAQVMRVCAGYVVRVLFIRSFLFRICVGYMLRECSCDVHVLRSLHPAHAKFMINTIPQLHTLQWRHPTLRL